MTCRLTLLDLVSARIFGSHFDYRQKLTAIIVGTAYEGGIFRCKLVVDSEFPQKPPKGKYT